MHKSLCIAQMTRHFPSVSGKMTSKGIQCDKDEVDNCSTHPKGATVRLSCEPFAFLPANTKSVNQPCDVGKIRNLSCVIHNESGESISFPCPSALQQKSLNICNTRGFYRHLVTKPCLFLRDIFINVIQEQISKFLVLRPINNPEYIALSYSYLS